MHRRRRPSRDDQRERHQRHRQIGSSCWPRSRSGPWRGRGTAVTQTRRLNHCVRRLITMITTTGLPRSRARLAAAQPLSRADEIGGDVGMWPITGSMHPCEDLFYVRVVGAWFRRYWYVYCAAPCPCVRSGVPIAAPIRSSLRLGLAPWPTCWRTNKQTNKQTKQMCLFQ